MARWELMEDHYLFGHPPDLEECEWEYKETERLSGRERRKRFKVPFYFDKGTIVCYDGKGQPGDFTFEGPPGPNMKPLDDEARAISQPYHDRGDWKMPMGEEAFPGQGYTESVLQALTRQLEKAALNQPTAPISVDSSVSREEFNKLQEQLAQLIAQNAELRETKPTKSPARRVT